MDDQLVTVRNCNWLQEAEVIKSVLAAEGIEAEIPDEQLMGVQPLYGAGIGGVKVMVRASDLERAEDVLKATVEP